MLDQLTGAHSKAIALDVLFSEPTNNADDSALVAAIARAGNVVTAAQLSRTESGRVVWLRPYPLSKRRCGVGHVHVSTEVDGVAGSFLVRQADDQGQAEWAMASKLFASEKGQTISPSKNCPGL